MHKGAHDFIQQAAGQVRLLQVLEIGSLNINGTPRGLFGAAVYHGIDRVPGPGVDEICDAKDFDGEESYHIAVSAEVLEHAGRPEDIIECAWRSLVPGGYLILTCAGEARKPHNEDCGTAYRNVYVEGLRDWLEGWDIISIERARDDKDIYALARKPRE